jgi:hypothetical protein
LRKFARLSRTDKGLVLRAVGLLAISSLGLRFFTPQRMIRILVQDGGSGKAPQKNSPDRVAWSVNAATQIVRGSSCLTRAIAGAALLKRAGYPATIQLGVAVNDGKGIHAHAWVECEGKLVLGGPECRAEYTPLAALTAG